MEHEATKVSILMDSTRSFNGYRFADIMLEHMSAGVAIFDARELRLLEANTIYFHLIDSLSKDIHIAPGISLLEFEQYEAGRQLLAICRRVIASGVPGRAEEVCYQSDTRGPTY